MSNKDQYFKLFSHCIIVRGASRSTVCDLQRNELSIIPNDVYDFLKDCETKSISEIASDYGKENIPVIKEYISFLIQKEYGFLTRQPELYTFLNTDFDVPGFITNAIIDINSSSEHDFPKIIRELEDLGCKYIQLRFFDDISTHELKKILNNFYDSRIRSIELLIKYNNNILENEWHNIYYETARATRMIIHSAPETKQIDETGKYWFITNKVDAATHCGIIHPDNFAISIQNYLEGIKNNTCLNKKISIDVQGFICNCPATPEKYGHFSDTSLHEALSKAHFKKYWEINKDQIEICKDCEFRRVCTDCRAFIQEENNLYSKPSKCSYDPYTATWA